MKRTRPSEVEVLVVGGGASGVAAAAAAARRGASCLLVERRPYLGGIASSAEVGTICGLFLTGRGTPSWIVDGFPREFGERVARYSGSEPMSWRDRLHFIPYRTSAFVRCCEESVNLSAVTTRLECRISGAMHHDGIVECVTLSDSDGTWELEVGAVVDCSGDAEIARLTNSPRLVDGRMQAPSLVFELSGLPQRSGGGVDDAALLLFLDKELRKLAPVDPEAGSAVLSRAPEPVRGGRMRVKLTLTDPFPSEGFDIDAMERGARRLVAESAAALASSSSELGGVRVSHVARALGIRTGPRHRGAAVLTEDDVLSGGKPADWIARSGWPIERWGSTGRAELTMLAEHDWYGIPPGCIRVEGFDNVFAAGRHISAEEGAIASARVIGTCLATGFAAGASAGVAARGQTVYDALPLIRF